MSEVWAKKSDPASATQRASSVIKFMPNPTASKGQPPPLHSLARPAIPQLDGLVEGGAGHDARVRREEHLVDEGLVSCHPGEGLLVLCWGPQE